jgi:flagellin-like protein
MAKKGITDIIAIVLLLMITISMVGFAWIWFQRTSQAAMDKTQKQLENNQNISGQTIMIDNVDKVGGSITIRNTGTQVINAAQIGIYANGNRVVCNAPFNTTNLAMGSTLTCINATSSIVGCSSVRVSAPGNIDTMDCS